MRQTVLTGLAVVCVSVLTACEDGPTQTYKPSPEGAGDNWNDGKSSSSSDMSKQGFTGTLGGTNAIELCDAPTRKMVWGKAFSKPISPPRGGGGITMSGPPGMEDTWIGLTVEQAEKVNCQSFPGGDWFGDGNFFNYWGDNGELVFEYLISTRKLVYMGFNPGYTGTIKFGSRDGMHTYEMALNKQIFKDGSPYIISWDANPNTGKDIWANELTDALFWTFSPSLPAEPPPNGCRVDGHCIIGNFGDQGYMYIPALGFAFRVANINAAQPTPSVTYYFDQYLAKTMGFSVADPVLKLDQEGPIAVASPLGPSNNPKTCRLKLGMTYDDLQKNCVKVADDVQKDTAEENKLLGGLTHGTERFHFDLTGVDVNFSDRDLMPDAVIGDKDVPSSNDVATQFRVDQATLGKIANDYTANNPLGVRDLHMTGLVYAEFVRLVQEKVNAYSLKNYGVQHVLGDPACLTGNTDQAAAAHCSGFEGFVIPLAASKIADANMKKLAVDPSLINQDPGGVFTNYRRGLKPGHQSIYLCDGDGSSNVQKNCNTSGDTMPTAFARLLKVFGQGKLAKLPPEMQDARFFFRQWTTALFKYLLTEDGSGTANTTQVQAANLQFVDMFNDSSGSGQFETAEYIDRRWAGINSEDLTDISTIADVRNGIMNDFTFSRDIFRGEEAIYTSVRENDADWPGKEQNALITNIFGSPLLLGFWKDINDTSKNFTATAYECATAVKDCSAYDQGEPLDELGNTLLNDLGQPIMTSYKGAFTTSGTIFRLGAYTPITVKKEYPTIQSVMLTFPQHGSPYDTSSAPGPNSQSSVDFLIPWDKKQPGIGFNIPINGQQNKFIMAYEAFLGGNTISANIAYDYVDPKNTSKGIALLSVETSDFLGSVFLCIDPNDDTMLEAKMYTPVAVMLDWINKHSQAASDCGIIVRFSPYGNYPDFITSLSNGVEVEITQGGGFGRVIDVDMFVPGQ